MVIPRPQAAQMRGDVLCLPATVTVKVSDEYSQTAFKAMQLFLPDVCFEIADDAVFCFIQAQFDKPEAYSIEIGDTVVLSYGDALGARNAVATLAQLLTVEANGYSLPRCRIEDYPAFGVRSFMLDLARGIGRKEEIKETLVRMALMKYNRIHLHLIDSEGVAWQSQAYPLLTGPHGDQYSMQYFKELDKLCAILGLEVLPELEVPAHNGTILKCYPELSCAVDPKEHPAAWVLCAGNEDIFEFYRALIGELVEMFPSCKTIHIGGDEVNFNDIAAQQCHWDFCPLCQALGYHSMQEIHYYVIKRVYDIVKSYGKHVAMWNDWIDISKPCPLPKDIEIIFWRIAMEGRGPVEGCSFEKFLEQGYKVVNAHFEETYFCNKSYASAQSLSDWLPTKRPYADKKYHPLILGGEGCAWEYGNEERYRFYRFTLPAPMGLLADRLWNGTYHTYDREYETALTRAILGVHCPADFNIFELLGTIMLEAKTEKLGVLENIFATRDELEAAVLAILPITVSDNYGHFAALYYTECLQWIMEHQ